VNGVLGEVRRDSVDVAAVERRVVGADVVEVSDDEILTWACRSGPLPFVVMVNAAIRAAD
jgi:hypothetical protein